MQIDKITFSDISIFHSEEEFSIFHKLNFTKTLGGKEWLRRFFSEPHHDLKRIIGTQNIIKALLSQLDDWPTEITNGTIIVIDKFLDYNLDPVPENTNVLNSYSYKILHSPDYSMIKYSIKHFGDFYRGLVKMLRLFQGTELPASLSFYLERINHILKEEPLRRLAAAPDEEFTVQQNLYYAFYLRGQYKQDTLELIEIFSRIEAWYSMAMAVKAYDLKFPEFIEQEEPFFNAEGLYHVMLPKPVAYDLVLQPRDNFLFLTGANMAGKSTMI
ncbi:MAG TPA: DNA mismatch repair protein MutS, partial [Chitinophagaceae bacterium]|nr:DNA mismatch repair protein MutS [Chitinophagaceae bacterium]